MVTSGMILDDDEVRRLMHELRDRATDLYPVWRIWERRLASHNRKVFKTEAISIGAMWHPLSPRYAAWKAKHYPGKTILRRTDRLFRSLTKIPMAVSRIHAADAEFGTDVPYAIFHQRGTANMPARPPVTVSEPLQNELNRLVSKWVTTGKVPKR